MDNKIIKNNSLNCGAAIKILTVVSLVFTIFNCLRYFIRLVEIFPEPFNTNVVFSFPDMDRWPFLLFDIVPIILMALYVFLLHNKLKPSAFFLMVFGSLSLGIVYDFLNTLTTRGVNYLYYYDYISYFLRFVVLVCLVLAAISAIKTFNKKVFITSVSVCLLCNILFFISHITRFVQCLVFKLLDPFSFTILSFYVGLILLYTALLLLGLKNKTISAEKEKLDAAQALKLLKNKLDLNMISEEEYQAQRAEIISKL